MVVSSKHSSLKGGNRRATMNVLLCGTHLLENSIKYNVELFQ